MGERFALSYSAAGRGQGVARMHRVSSRPRSKPGRRSSKRWAWRFIWEQDWPRRRTPH